jgi:hypothetical protein
LPAAAYPLQIVEAARFLEALESDPGLKPEEDWDDSVVALLNYPEVVTLLNDDLDWTLRLGEAVIAQQADVVAAVEAFRDRAYAAGNLKSDDYQTVSANDGVISIAPVSEDVIYVPYYEPSRVVYYQPEPVYYYYPRPYPVYYYPYGPDYHFSHGYFWGVTTAFTIGWYSDSLLHVYHPSYYGHPYYGHSYWDHWYYRRPSISVYNTNYVRNVYVNNNRYSNGDRWHARETRREYVRREGYSRNESRGGDRTLRHRDNPGPRVPVSFRERDARPASRDTSGTVRTTRNSSGGAARVVNDARDVSRNNVSGTSRENVRREPQQRTPTVASTQSTRTQSTRRYTPAAQTRDTRRQEQPVRQAYQPAPARTYQPAPARSAPVRTYQPAPARTYQPAPARTERAPAPQQRSASSAPARAQPATSSAPRGREKSNGGNERSASQDRHSRGADRRR